MATKKITDLTKLTDLDATDSFVVNDSSAGADKRVEFSDLQTEILNGAVIGGSTAITQLTVDNLRLDGNTISSQDTNGNILLQPNGTGDVVINDAGADSDFIVEGDTDTSLLVVDASADRVGIGTSTPATILDVDGTITSTGLSVSGTTGLDGAVTINESGANVDFRVEGDTDANLLFVDASTDRVGIGTDTPTELLDVDGTIKATTLAGTLSTASQTNITSVGTLTGLSVSGTTGLDGAVTINDTGADVDFRVEGDTDANLLFVDASTDKVGIGTSTFGAGAKFQTNGRIYAMSSSDVNLAFVLNNTASGGREWQFVGSSTGGLGGGGKLVFRDQTAGANRLTITDAGDIGIGSDSPSARLDVRGSAVFNENGADADFRIEGDTDANLLFVDASTDRVGISTNAPDALLTVDGIASFGDGAVGTPSIANAGDLDTGLWFPAANTIAFSEGGAEAMRITDAGNVKIGGTANRATTEGTKQLVLFNGTAPVGTLANGVSFYSASGEANVMDAAGNATLLSPHDKDTNEWIFRSKHTPTGKVLKIDVERMLRFINDHFGLDMIEEFTEA